MRYLSQPSSSDDDLIATASYLRAHKTPSDNSEDDDFEDIEDIEDEATKSESITSEEEPSQSGSARLYSLNSGAVTSETQSRHQEKVHVRGREYHHHHHLKGPADQTRVYPPSSQETKVPRRTAAGSLQATTPRDPGS
jgi:hypothetical protein